MNVKPINPGARLAPRPTRSSYARSLYDAVESCAGPCTLQEILELIPGTDDAFRWNEAKPTRVLTLLDSGVYQGYLAQTPDHKRWQVASNDYYLSRLAINHAAQSGRNANRKKPVDKQIHTITVYRNLKWIEAAAIALASLTVGMILAPLLWGL